MKNVRITSVEVNDKLDELSIVGTVDGRLVSTKGFVSRLKNSKDEDARQRYMRELMLRGDELQGPELSNLVGAAPQRRSTKTMDVVWHWMQTNWILVSVSVILAEILNLFVSHLRW
jgi:hypothetical protein